MTIAQIASGAMTAVNVLGRTGAAFAALKAAPYLMELASRAFTAAVNAFPSVSNPVNAKIELAKGYLPVQSSFEAKTTKTDLAKGAATYLTVAAVSVFALNRLAGPAPAFYNNAANHVGNFFAGRVDVLAMAVKRFV